ncbi:MAG TPA: class I SAM-dependent methyltransferase [Tepidiformaceae bacterium]
MAHDQWTALWRALAAQEVRTEPGAGGEGRMVERWRLLARRLDDGSAQRPDPILDFVMGRLDSGMTVLDIGAGVGRWSIPIAERVRSVTAVEPVEGMCQVLEERLRARNQTKVSVVRAAWMNADVATHDVVVAAYSMYGSPDLAAFARKMEASARRLCCMAVRVPPHDGVMGELSERIRGEWHDSPNFIVAYNALLEAGFLPNVFVEPVAIQYWTDGTLAEAQSRARRHLRLTDDRYDKLISETLERRLEKTPDGYRWPDWMRSALIWWEPSAGSTGM